MICLNDHLTDSVTFANKQPKRIMTRRSLEIGIVAVVLSLGLALTICAAFLVLPFIPSIISGVLCLLLFAVWLILRAPFYISLIKKPVSFSSNLFKDAHEWCVKEIQRRRALTDPNDPSRLKNEAFFKSNGLPNEGEIFKICTEENKEEFRLVCEYRENQPMIIHLGVVIGCYPIIIKSLLKRDISAREEFGYARMDNKHNIISILSKKSLTAEDILLVLNGGRARGNALMGIEAGVFWMFRSYMVLRTGLTNVTGKKFPHVEEEQFFTPGTDYYFARLIFNHMRRAMLSVFPLALLKKYSEKKGDIRMLYEFCSVPDEGADFLRVHKDYRFTGRGIYEDFCN